MSSCFSLPGLADQLVALNTWGSALRFFAEALRLFAQALVERSCLLEASAFHCAAPFREWAGAQLAISSPVDAEVRAVTLHIRMGRGSRSVQQAIKSNQATAFSD
jgi:hypothetical protein